MKTFVYFFCIEKTLQIESFDRRRVGVSPRVSLSPSWVVKMQLLKHLKLFEGIFAEEEGVLEPILLNQSCDNGD